MEREEKLRALIEKIAKEKKYDNCNITVEPVTSGGANYTSHLYRATLTAPGKDDLHMFAKVAALGEELMASFTTNPMIIEHRFYKDLVETYRRIEEKNNIKDVDKFVTPTFYGSSEEHLYEVLVLENLTKRGYESFDRFKSIDWPYAAYSIRQLAIFHALSFAYAKEDPEGYKNFVQSVTLPPEFNEKISQIIPLDVDKTLGAIRKENEERVHKFIERPGMRNPYLQLANSKGPVVIHGDYRPSNMMHKVHTDGTTEVIVLDYQTLREGSPVIDLLYLLFMSTDKKFREQYFRKSFAHYYSELCSALQRFNLDPEELYSEKTFREDVKEHTPNMLSFSFFALLVITVDEARGQISENMDNFKDMMANDLYVERVNDWVDDCIAMGVL